jgi:hypothetical protein
MRKILNAGLTSVMFLFTSAVMRANVITVTSYSMNNGGTGAFDYEDRSYLPCPGNDCNTTGASLSGGAGQLTNGFDATSDWDAGQGAAGRYWIGWDTAELNGADPVVTFNFGAVNTVNSITVWFDNTLGAGGVGAPGEILVNGTAYTPPQNVAGPQAFSISGLSITSNSVNVQFEQSSDQWIMIGQVSFSGGTGAPEPSSVLLLISALGGFILLIRKRTSSS